MLDQTAEYVGAVRHSQQGIRYVSHGHPRHSERTAACSERRRELDTRTLYLRWYFLVPLTKSEYNLRQKRLGILGDLALRVATAGRNRVDDLRHGLTELQTSRAAGP